jgi:Family of unknown function (DUF6328)
MSERMPDPDEDQRADSAWDARERNETPTERLDRNWADLLQELRVVQTGVQLLTGFLLTLPFQNRFAQLSAAEQDIYLATLSAAVAATGFLIAPVSLHRTLFRRHARRVTVAIAHRLAIIGIVLLAVAIVGVLVLIFEVIKGDSAGIVAGVIGFALLGALWLGLPIYVRSKGSDKIDV